jgi:hypothetical protein
MLRDVNAMLGVCWLQHQPSLAFDNVSNPVFHRALVNVIPCHILEIVTFPIPESQIIRHVSQELLDAIAVFEVSERQSCVFLLQQVVSVRPHALFLDPTLDIFVLFTRH